MSGEPPTVVATPVLLARVGWGLAAFFVALFTVIAIVMPYHSAGATFTVQDQIAAGLIGPLLAVAVLALRRPRVVADADGVWIRGFFAPPKTIPWDVVVGVRFPASAQSAQLVLPGEELVSLLALQRMDGERSVAAMRGLRELFAYTRTGQANRSPGPAPGSSG